nr:type II toxin-antitoxin system Phd/YefM family antitoxin [Roseicella aquatilis]
MQRLRVREARARFSAVVGAAAKGDATVVRRHGEPVAVVLGYAAWPRLAGVRPGFADLLLAFPDAGEIERDPTPAHDIGP